MGLFIVEFKSAKTYTNSIKFKNKLGIFLKEKVSKNDFIAGKKILSLKIF